MKLRELKFQDADRMIEWMHDPFVVEKLRTDFSRKTKEDCLSFIENSRNDKNFNLAITDDDDVYMGTVSLKHITSRSAEFAITVHRDAMGKGYALWAMKEMLDLGFKEYHINEIYWCVAKDNLRALKFYDKNGFGRIGYEELSISDDYSLSQIKSYVWYRITANDYLEDLCKL